MAIPTGRSHEGVRWTVLSAIKEGGFSTFKCEADPKFSHMVTHLIETGELVRVPSAYPWVGVKPASLTRSLRCLCGKADEPQPKDHP
jgi:hypothetical protein